MMDPRYSPFEPKGDSPPPLDPELLRAAGLELAAALPLSRPPRKSRSRVSGPEPTAGHLLGRVAGRPQLRGRPHLPGFVVPTRPVLEIGTTQQRILWRDSATILSGVIITMLLARAVIPTELAGEADIPTPDPTTVTVVAPLPTFRLVGVGATPGEVVDPNLPLNRPTIIPVITLPPPTQKPSPSSSPTAKATVKPSASASPTAPPTAAPTPTPTPAPTPTPTPAPTPMPTPTKKGGPH